MSSSSCSQTHWCRFFSSSIGKKQVMALTGLALCGFLVSHLLGNCLLLLGPDTFNLYAHKLTSNNLIYVAEGALVLIFLSHVFMAIRLTIENKKARPERYHAKKKTGRGATFASSTMPFSGLILLAFIILHLMNFKYGTHYETFVDGAQIRDLYKTVIEYFSNPLYVAWYVFAMIVMGFHVSHGFQSSFQSLGLNHPKYTPKIKLLSLVFAVVVSGGFSFLSIWSYMQNN
ncbi:MAG: succinate dehydrogenase cytochrome b subunit [Halobacteriovoraceae bacterium]|nr:succinate dehydrogenase cytochrome b subunit [Halobacteriovoraceae bacterium]